MEPFVTHRGRLTLLDWSDVNTDLIIPARYLKRIERIGYGPLLFADKRYQAGAAPEPDEPERHGPEDPEFPLNQPAVKGATILVVGPNFGCGSSREHAVWAVMQGGYKAVIAPGKGRGFADIFEGNALNNGLLVIELDESDWSKIAEAARATPGRVEATVDLREQTVTLHTSSPLRFSFSIPESDRNRLLNGLDAIGETLQQEADISRYEQQAPSWLNPQPVQP